MRCGVLLEKREGLSDGVCSPVRWTVNPNVREKQQSATVL